MRDFMVTSMKWGSGPGAIPTSPAQGAGSAAQRFERTLKEQCARPGGEVQGCRRIRWLFPTAADETLVTFSEGQVSGAHPHRF